MPRAYLIALSVLLALVALLVLGAAPAATSSREVTGPPAQRCWQPVRKPVTERDLARSPQPIEVVLPSTRSGPPDTLAAIVAGADAIVVAHIARQDFRIEPCGGVAMTLATAEVRTVIKDHPLLAASGGRLIVHRLGGAWREASDDGGTRVVRARDDEYPSFVTGGEYVLFLKTSRFGYRWPTDVWVPSYAQHGTVRIGADGTLQPLASAGDVSRAAAAKSLADFTAQLRASARFASGVGGSGR